MTAPAARHTIASYVASPAFAPGARAALEHLGYHMTPAVLHGRWEDASWPSDVRIVDERHVARVPRDATPIVVLARNPVPRWDNERIIGVVERPATLAALYPLFQQALEDHPRKAARAKVDLAARGNLADRRFPVEIRTLSERGARIETEQALEPEARINLALHLPGAGPVSLRARVVTWDAPRGAVEFVDTPPDVRLALSDFIQRRLATA